MDNTEKLLRAFIKAQGYEITGLDTSPCVKQCEGMPTIFDGGDYKVTKKEKYGVFSVDPNYKILNFGLSIL